jgi:hypothetical protein
MAQAVLQGKVIAMRAYIKKIRDITNKKPNNEPKTLRKTRTSQTTVSRQKK